MEPPLLLTDTFSIFFSFAAAREWSQIENPDSQLKEGMNCAVKGSGLAPFYTALHPACAVTIFN
jgi:hypothetical protein